MNDERSFLTALARAPDDEALRLVFADWLEEQGDPRGPWLRDPDIAPWLLPDARDPVPRLVVALEDPSQRQAALRALVKLGRPAVAGLVSALSTNNDQAGDVAEALCQLRSPEVQKLVARLRTADWHEQLAAVQAMGQLGEEAATALPELLPLLGHERQRLSEAVVDTLENMGPLGPPALRVAWNRHGWNSRSLAWRLFDAMVRLGPHPDSIGVLIGALDGGGDICEAACGALKQLGLPVARPLLDAAENLNSERWEWASIVLSGLGEGVAPLLIEAVRQRQPQSLTHTVAVVALGDLAEKCPSATWLDEAATALTAGLGDASGIDHYVLRALEQCGPAGRVALPILRPFLHHEDAWARQAALGFLAAVGDTSPLEQLEKDLSARSTTKRAEAVSSLARMAPAAPAEVAALLGRAARDRAARVRLAALQALAGRWPAGISVVDPLRQALADEDARIRTLAIQALMGHAAQASVFLDDLVRLLRDDPDDQVRIQAVRAFQNVRPFRTAQTLPAVCAATRDPCGLVRSASVATLRDWGEWTAEMVPYLLACLDDPEQNTAENALYTLVQIRDDLPPGTDAILRAGLVEGRRDFYPRLEALAQLGHRFAEADIPLLLRVLETSPPAFAQLAARLLGQIGPAAIPHLVPLLEPGDPRAGNAALALGEIGRAAAAALPALRHLVSDLQARVLAAEAIGRIGNPAEAVALLRPMLALAHGGGAVPALARFIPESLAALPELLQLLREGEWAFPWSPLRPLLGQLAEHAPEVALGLRDLLREGEFVGARAASALQGLGPRAAVAVPELGQLLIRCRDESARVEVMLALGAIGPAAAVTVPDLIGFLASSSFDIYRAALRALGDIGPPAHEALPAIEPFRHHEDALIRETAARAIASIRGEGA